VWALSADRGEIIAHDHVGDSRLTTTAAAAARKHFHAAWAAAFREDPEEKPTTEDFTGLRHRVVSPRCTEISCVGVLRRLEALLLDYPLTATEMCDCPLPGDALRRLRDAPTDKNPLVPTLLEPAQRVLGTAGFVVNAVRVDAYFGYCVLSRYTSDTRLTSGGSSYGSGTTSSGRCTCTSTFPPLRGAQRRPHGALRATTTSSTCSKPRSTRRTGTQRAVPAVGDSYSSVPTLGAT